MYFITNLASPLYMLFSQSICFFSFSCTCINPPPSQLNCYRTCYCTYSSFESNDLAAFSAWCLCLNSKSSIPYIPLFDTKTEITAALKTGNLKPHPNPLSRFSLVPTLNINFKRERERGEIAREEVAGCITPITVEDRKKI